MATNLHGNPQRSISFAFASASDCKLPIDQCKLAISLHLFSAFPKIRSQFPALRQPFYFESGLSRGCNEFGQPAARFDYPKADVIERNE